MSLICVRDYREVYYEYNGWEVKAPILFSSCLEIQNAFCSRIECEQSHSYRKMKKNDTEETPGYLFLESREIQDYLALYGIKYVGNFLLENTWNSKWDELPEEKTEKMKSREFVTWLSYPLQLACLALRTRIPIYVEKSAVDCLNAKHLKPVVEKKDLFCKITRFNIEMIEDFVMAGCDVIFDHESITEQFKNCKSELWFYLEDDLFPKYITRELDARVFDENIIKKFTSFTPRRILLSELEEEYLGSDHHWLLKKHPELAKAVYIENAEPVFSECNKRPPIYLLWMIDDAWYFLHENSFKNPTYLEVVLQAALSPEELSPTFDKPFDVASVEKVFALVLDVDEICDASEYWESIGFYLKYDRRENVIEICEKNSAIIEFHNLLQESTNLEDSFDGYHGW